MINVSVATGLSLTPSIDELNMMHEIIEACQRDHDLFLDVIDATLRLKQLAGATSLLRETLALGGSAWTVSESGRGLERRVDPTAAESFGIAISPDDEASKHLREAWESAYGRQPDASDSWDHAIKAVEAVLIPIIVPNKDKPTLGDVAGQLTSASFTFGLKTAHPTLNEAETLEAMVRLMWPNPDRHAGSTVPRTPTLSESCAVVQLAVTLVQWSRTGVIQRR